MKESVPEQIGDSTLAIALSCTIAMVDRMAFGRKSTAMTRVVNRRSDGRDALARFWAATDVTPDIYEIYQPGLADEFHDARDEHGRMFRRNGNVCTTDPFRMTFPTRGEFLAVIAAHEVRHRIQHRRRGKITLFSPETAEAADPLVRTLLSFFKLVLRKPENRFVPSDPANPYEEGDEFDAAIVQLIALYHARGKDPFRNMRSILWAEPSSVFWRPAER